MLIFLNYNTPIDYQYKRNPFMTKILKGALVALMLVGFTGCVTTSDISVSSEQSEKVDLKGYKTYQFIHGSGISDDAATKKILTNNDKLAGKIESLINEQLMKKGKVPVSNDPDFLVAYLGGADMEEVKSKLDKNGREVIEKRPEAALMLMLVDAETGSILWISTAEGEVKAVSHEEKRKRLEYAVKKMLDSV